MYGSTFQVGDIFLLFRELPFQFDQHLPLTIAPNVYLDSTPHAILASADPHALADFVLPGYNLPGMGVPNCCMRVSPIQEGQRYEANDILFLSVLSLRLQAPIVINIAGRFELGPAGDLLQNPGLFNLTTSWQPKCNRRYSGKDICAASEIAAQICQVDQLVKPIRLMSAIALFSQVSCGLVQSLQLACLGLFSALEALFVPKPQKGNRADCLGRRVASFLFNFDPNQSLERWVTAEYIHVRSQIAHGIHDLKPFRPTLEERQSVFGQLHEITRLCILGFLSLDCSDLERLSRVSGNALQSKLDVLGCAEERFLKDQHMWLV